MSKKEADPAVAVLLGRAYAYLQHGMDRVIEWGFWKMKQSSASETKNESKKGSVYLRRAKKVLRTIFGFAGTAGESYSATYEKLKSKDKGGKTK